MEDFARRFPDHGVTTHVARRHEPLFVALQDDQEFKLNNKHQFCDDRITQARPQVHAGTDMLSSFFSYTKKCSQKIVLNYDHQFRFCPPLWSKWQHARLSHSRPGFDPQSGHVSWVRFFRGFSSPIKEMLGSFRPPRSPNNIWPS